MMTTTQSIKDAIRTIEQNNPEKTDGKWLELVTKDVAPLIKEWDIQEAYLWSDWPERDKHFPQTTKLDIGIDVVAVRRYKSDSEYIAIQCKARQLDEQGRGADIHKNEINTFITASSSRLWAERWLVTNGNNSPSDPSTQVLSMQRGQPLKFINIHKDLVEERDSTELSEDDYQSTASEDVKQTKTAMQNEAVATSVRILKEHESTDSGGLPKGQARGRIILPCGTGKTRIALRIIEELTSLGELSIVLCPSIALVAQIRREFLRHTNTTIRALAVCSDQTAGYDPKREDSIDIFNNPTADNSNVSAAEVKGKVTTDAQEIADWIKSGKGGDAINVVFGTYQSGRKVADALKLSGETAKVLIADEAHRTAGFRRKKAKSDKAQQEEQQIRDFTLCHDNKEFPAIYRIYQTATPKVFDVKNKNHDDKADWIVRSMDDESVFGVELFRKSYREAVHNGWLADYRIIALGVNDPEAFKQANELASSTSLNERKAPTTALYLKGLAFTLAIGGAVKDDKGKTVSINSCIAFMNTVARSKEMSKKLQTAPVRAWLQRWLDENAEGQAVRHYSLEHLDATSNVSSRDEAKLKLKEASKDHPYGIINVGIFGEGTDAPSLSAVAFLEARKSPLDVVQAVGRVMRTASKKERGYIICPIMIPTYADPEQWLSVSNKDEGWDILGQLLMALRAHDQRIEDSIADLLHIYLPREPDVVRKITAVVNENNRIQYGECEGKPGSAEEKIEKVLNGKSTFSAEFNKIEEPQKELKTPEPTLITNMEEPRVEFETREKTPITKMEEPRAEFETGEDKDKPKKYKTPAPTGIAIGKKTNDGGIEIRIDTVERDKPAPDGTPGAVNVDKCKKKAKKMINEGEGQRVTPPSEKRKRKTPEEKDKESGQMLLDLSGMGEHGDAIRMNLLAKSGLAKNRSIRDFNLIENAIKDASYHLREDELTEALNRHFGLDNLKDEDLAKQADGCTIATLLMMNAAMLHQRIVAGDWLTGISDLSVLKSDTAVVQKISREWNRIMAYDFQTVFNPAIESIYAIEETGKISGLERALRHIAVEAERLAETYADMGADYAGPLFNKVMGNQASDGAFFTRPPAASLAARLTLDALGEQDWTNPNVWHQNKTVDLACGSGTLLAAMLTEMKRRAKAQGAKGKRISELQKIAVEEVIKGMDINPVSLQLAAAQLTAGNQDVRYRKMGLHQMPYGLDKHDPNKVSAGTLELLGQKAIVDRNDELDMDIPDDVIHSQSVYEQDDADLENAVDAAKDARIIIMNPPFTNRANVGEKFFKHVQQKLRTRVDRMEQYLVQSDKEMNDFVGKNSVGPIFEALADRCLIKRGEGVLTMLYPTTALTNASGHNKRLIFAKRYHIHTIVTSHQRGNINLSQETNINESIVVMKRCQGAKPHTRFIHLDRMPSNESQVEDLHRCLLACQNGDISDGWGEVSYWDVKHIERGDWTPAIWRSPELAKAANLFSHQEDLHHLQSMSKVFVHETGRTLCGPFQSTEQNTPGGFPVIKSKGADGQKFIIAQPDEYCIPKGYDNERSKAELQSQKILQKSGHLLITAGQDNSTARLTAVASEKQYVGNGWAPVTGLSPREAKAVAVFINSTPGRFQLMRNPGRKIEFPQYSVKVIRNIRIPDIKDERILGILAECWEHTKNMDVPQFRDGECDVRCLWDEAVAKAMNWDADELTRLRHLLHKEPHVRGLGYEQHADEPEE